MPILIRIDRSQTLGESTDSVLLRMARSRARDFPRLHDASAAINVN